MSELKKTITRDEELQLLGLVTLGRQHRAVVDQCEEAMEKLLGATERYQVPAGDVLYDDARNIAWLLESAGIEVVA